MADAGYFGPNGGWVRAAHRPPIKKKQISVRLPEDVLDRAERTCMDLSARPPFAEVTISDLVRRGLELAMAELVPPAPRPAPCHWVIVGERSLCAICGSKGADGAEGECKYDGQ